MVATHQDKLGVARYSIGIDIRGTFTDVTVEEIASGRRGDFKTPTVSANPSIGVVNGLHLAEQASIPIDKLDYFAHGTTIGDTTEPDPSVTIARLGQAWRESLARTGLHGGSCDE